MKKAKQNDETLAAMSQVDPFEFGYNPDAGITISGALFMALMNLAGTVAHSEGKEYVEVVAFKLGDTPKDSEERMVRILTTPLGLQAEEILNQIMSVHMENINVGLATNKVQGPKLDMGDAPKG